MITSEQVISSARRYLDVPFAHQGRSVHGLDCAGLVVVTMRDLGVVVTDDTTYRRIPNAGKLRNHLDKYLEPDGILRGLRVGLFWTGTPEYAVHLGFILPDHRLLHAWYDARRVVETELNNYWTQRFVTSYRLPGVLD